jgi:hypothetical protein
VSKIDTFPYTIGRRDGTSGERRFRAENRWGGDYTERQAGIPSIFGSLK